MKAKTTRRALLMSVLSLLLCVSMLVGTTFAWFTDSVTSGRNTIQAGNLDVVLEYWDGDSYEEVTSTTKLFNDAALWEPGYTEVAYLKVSNAGSLALKYHLAISVYDEILGKTKTGADIKLSDHLQFKAVESDVDLVGTYASREDALNANATATKLLTYNGDVKPLEAKNEAGDNNYYDYVALIIYMPTTVGDEANHDGANVPSIQMGVNLMATQLTHESDSFDNQYDKEAGWDGTIPDTKPDTLVVDTTNYLVSINSTEAFAYLNTLVNDSDFATKYGSVWKYTIELNVDVNLMNKAWTPIALRNFVAFEGNGHTISNLNVSTNSNNAGLFAFYTCNDNGFAYIRNLTIDGASVKGAQNVGVLVGSGTCTAENVTVINAAVDAEKYVGGLAGRLSSAENCTVKNCTVQATDKTVGGLVGYAIGDPGNTTFKGNTVDTVTVTGAWNVGGMLGQAQNVTVEGNTVKNATVTSTTPLPANASSNEVRTAEVAARSAFDNTTIGANTVENVTLENKPVYEFTVTNDAELIAALETIKTDANFHNREVSILMAAGTYSGNYEINQYPNWNGTVGAGASANNYGFGVPSGDPITKLVFEGQTGVIFTGNVKINGFGNAGTGFSSATATTTFKNVTFDAANSVEANGEDYAVVSVGAAANNVTFDGCTFQNATHVLLGSEGGAGAAGRIDVKNCTFNDGGCLSGYFETLNVSNTNVTAAKNGFINKSKAGSVTVTGGTMNVGKYFLRTSNSGVNMTVTGADITLYESEGEANLVKFRGSSESAVFDQCTLPATYATAGVDANSTLTVK